MARTTEDIDSAIALTRAEEYVDAFSLFVEIYGTEDSPPIRSAKDASGLSYFGLCVALLQKKYKPAIDLCKKAIELEFYNGDHYANLSRVYLAGNDRKKAVDTADKGLKLAPSNEYLRRVRKKLGVRARPAVPMLDRSNPINIALGQVRHARKAVIAKKKKKDKK